MRRVVELVTADTVPDRITVLRGQGIPARAESGRIRELLDGAFERYTALIQPRGLYQELSVGHFAQVYRGEGRNDEETPVAEVFPRADRLALFAVTLGQAVSDAITSLFASRELAEAAMLDAVASEGAERAVTLLAEHFLENLRADDTVAPAAAVLPYSPGYCGWHISGQQALFDLLGPREIGITLNSSHLMQPLKSVSGVLIAATVEAHDFDDSYDFCDRCATRGCRARLAEIG